MKHILKKTTRLKWSGRRLHFFHGDCQISCSQECLLDEQGRSLLIMLQSWSRFFTEVKKSNFLIKISMREGYILRRLSQPTQIPLLQMELNPATGYSTNLFVQLFVQHV